MLQSFSTPLYITLGVKKKKNYWINTNNYRNWHPMVNNNVKKAFKTALDLSHLKPVSPPIKLTYIFHYPDLSHRDIGNSLAIIDKFTADALTEAGIIEDDNYNIVTHIEGLFGSIDRENPRCDVTIQTLKGAKECK